MSGAKKSESRKRNPLRLQMTNDRRQRSLWSCPLPNVRRILVKERQNPTSWEAGFQNFISDR
jgi:hypothetical protein